MAAVSRQPRRVRVAAVVLAGGAGVRMGRQKLLLDLHGRPLVRWAVDAALGSAADETVVVVGHEAAGVSAALAGLPVSVIVNDAYREGMSSSLRAGVTAVGDRCDAAVILLGDQPFVTAELLDRLIARFATTGKGIVRPVVAGRPANPVLMSARLFPELLGQRGDVGGREVIDSHPADVALVPVDDDWVTADVDSLEDYEAARRHR